ncbi:MAG: Putative response regulator, CheY (Modular protein) [Nitrospira sp.]|nr:MAG: Putative response regulator, CheY (Modular protein) [Nitrospira sp.]
MTHTILCVEDEPDTGSLIQTILEREGYKVVRAVDGRQAICLIETILPPALILLDIVVPYVNGFELLAGLRRNPDWKHIPIVMLSADSYGPDIQRALNEGATAYVIKQQGFHELVQRVKDILEPVPANAPAATKPRRASPSASSRSRKKRAA